MSPISLPNPDSIATTHLRVHRYAGLSPGPRFIVTGAVHGNETAGTLGILRVMSELDAGHLMLARGHLSCVPICNPLAYQRRQRMGQRNLNRRLLPTSAPTEYEDHIANQLCPLLGEHEALLDLHSFRGQGEAFVLRGPGNNTGRLEPFAHAAAEARWCAHLGVRRVVDGWMDAYARGVVARRQRALTAEAGQAHPDYGVGTTEAMRRMGGYALTLECGSHEDPAGPQVAYHAIRQSLAVLGLVDQAPQPPEPMEAYECLSLMEVTDRHDPGDHFARPWASFDAVAAGELVAMRADGTPLRARENGRIVFPNEAAGVGQEWFYWAQPSARRLLE